LVEFQSFKISQMEGDLLFAPGFVAPPNTDYKSYHQYIDEFLLPESPVLYGLHPNAEIGSLTTRSENLFQTLMEMQPRDAGSSGGTGISRDDKVKNTVVNTILLYIRMTSGGSSSLMEGVQL